MTFPPGAPGSRRAPLADRIRLEIEHDDRNRSGQLATSARVAVELMPTMTSTSPPIAASPAMVRNRCGRPPGPEKRHSITIV